MAMVSMKYICYDEKVSKVNSNTPSPKDPDLSNIEFNSDGIVRMALGRKETQKKLWESIKAFADYPTKTNTKN